MLQLLTGRAYTNLSIRLKKMFHQPAENRLVGKPPQQKHYSRPRNSPVVFALANAGARLPGTGYLAVYRKPGLQRRDDGLERGPDGNSDEQR